MSESPATTGAPTPTDIDRRHRHLFDRRSVVGALVVVAVLSFFGFGLRAIDDNQKTGGFDVGSAYEVSPTVSFTPVAGWSIDKTNTVPGTVVTLTNEGVTAKLLALARVPGRPAQTAQGTAKVFRDGDKQNDAYTHVTDFETFATASGVHGVTWSATGPNQATQSWLVAQDDGTGAWLSAQGPASNWSNTQADLDAMAKSITVTAPAGGTP